jgi:hypothetical protein
MDRTDVAWKCVVRIWWAWLGRTVLVSVVVVASIVALLFRIVITPEPG